jgi:thiol:disulfide interchange protein
LADFRGTVVRFIVPITLALAVSLTAPGSLTAQNRRDSSVPRSHYTDGVIGQFDESALDALAEPATIHAKFTTPTPDRPATLLITAKIAHGRHTYSLTQPPGGPQPTRIELQPSSSYRQLSAFSSQPAPTPKTEEIPGTPGIKTERHEGQVTWYAPIELTAGIDPKTLEIRGTIHMQVCEDHGICEPVDKEFIAKLAPPSEVTTNLPAVTTSNAQSAIQNPQSEIPKPLTAIGHYQAPGSSVKLEGRLLPDTVRPGESAELEITATPGPHAHVYALAERDSAVGSKPTLIAIETATGLVPHKPSTNSPTKIENSEFFGLQKYHDSPVTWKLRIDVPKNAKPGEYPITGLFGYQACESGAGSSNTCESPTAVRFAAALKVGDATNKSASPISFGPGGAYRHVAESAAVFADNFDRQAPNRIEPPPSKTVKDETPVLTSGNQYELNRIIPDGSTRGSLSYYIALAFVGGLILNLMPCVLPVIGLKVMSFVEQAGKSRSHALVLNLWFGLGIVFVFVLLGLLAATLGLSWGGQFGSTAFNVTIAAVVFAMALSLLGVWEVPIPGFFGSGSVQSAATKEGPLGAFLKGVITTILATPCTAPFMASAIAWAVTQPVATTLTVFATLGVGMASPYVLVGVYPELLKFLPKPGPWMETFKQISGFVLLATVVFILSFIETTAIVPTLALLLGVAVACWTIARTPLTAEFGDRLKSWAIAGVVLLAFVGVSFGVLYRIATSTTGMAWQPFSLERLKQIAVDEGRTVIVDFSADWCLNCKFFEKTVLHTQPVEQAIARSGALKMYGDYTKYPPEITDTIKALGGNGVPVIAIFPGENPYEPIVFKGGYTKNDLISALDRAAGRRMRTASTNIIESTAAASPTTGR